jgi:hypothetical protein
MFCYIPQNHKDFIFHLLGPKDLVNLGGVNHSFYQNVSRKQILIRKLVEEYFYKSNHHVKTIQDWKAFQQFDSQNLFDQYYSEMLQSIQFEKDICVFSNPETSHAKYLKIQKYKYNTHSNFEHYTKDYQHLDLSIIFLIEKILKFPVSDKILIIENVIQYMNDLLDYSKVKNQMYDYPCQSLECYFDFYRLFQDCFHYFLSQLFEKDIEPIKLKIIQQLIELRKKTQIYALENFIEIIEVDCRNLKEVLDIAKLLHTGGVDEEILEYFFKFQFSLFFNLNSDDDLVEYDLSVSEMNKQLQDPSFRDEFYDMVRIFDPRGIFILSLNHSLSFRWNRFIGEMNEQTPEEDYDY